MRKSLILFFCLSAIVCAEWNGNRWVDEQYKFTFEIPGNWQIDPSSRRRVYTNRGDGVSEFYVEVFPTRPQGATANRVASDVAKDSMKSYDSWRYLAGREFFGGERKGAQSGFSVMYGRSVLQRATARTVQIIAQEGYFVKGDNAYIVTLITDSDTWESAKKELLAIWNSFRVQ